MKPKQRLTESECRKDKMGRICKAEYLRGSSCTERKLQRSTQRLSIHSSGHMYENICLRLGGKIRKELGGTIPRAHTGSRIGISPKLSQRTYHIGH